MFSSAKEDWATPKDLFDQLNAEFAFDLDAAANTTNALCGDFFGAGSFINDDALGALDWTAWGHTKIFCNPPYSRQLGKWLEKGWLASMAGATVVLLVPARTDTAWFQQAWLGEVRFIQGRLKFGDGANAAPFPSALVIFRPPNVGPYRWTVLR